jgi:hypothetical protein
LSMLLGAPISDPLVSAQTLSFACSEANYSSVTIVPFVAVYTRSLANLFRLCGLAADMHLVGWAVSVHFIGFDYT